MQMRSDPADELGTNGRPAHDMFAFCPAQSGKPIGPGARDIALPTWQVFGQVYKAGRRCWRVGYWLRSGKRKLPGRYRTRRDAAYALYREGGWLDRFDDAAVRMLLARQLARVNYELPHRLSRHRSITRRSTAPAAEATF